MRCEERPFSCHGEPIRDLARRLGERHAQSRFFDLCHTDSAANLQRETMWTAIPLEKYWARVAPFTHHSIVAFSVAVGYYAAAQFAFLIGTLSDRIFAPFWPPNAILFCGLLLVPRERWTLILALTFVAHVLAELSVGMPFDQMMVAFVTNCALALLNAIVVARFLKGPFWFGTLRKAAVFIMTACLSNPAIVALGGALVPIVGGEPVANYWVYWANWFVGNALAAMTFAPLILGWADSERRSFQPSPGWHHLEAGAFIVALLGVSIISLAVTDGISPSPFVPAVLYLPLPVVLWGSVRFGAKGASGAILILAAASIWLTLNGHSPFFGRTPETSVVGLQLFLIGLAVPVILLSAAIEELRQSAIATRAMAGSILRAQDDERRRIARDLHDSTGQNLIAVSMMLGGLKDSWPNLIEDTIAKSRELVLRSINELRAHAYVLHPPMLDEGGLAIALPAYVEGFAGRTGIEVDLSMAPNWGRFSTEIEILVYRVVQEALSNVHRHSGSSRAKIELSRRRTKFREVAVLTIEDQGTGMPDSFQNRGARRARGVGLDSMRERVRQVGGRFSIHSMPGRTVVTAMVPLDAK